MIGTKENTIITIDRPIGTISKILCLYIHLSILITGTAIFTHIMQLDPHQDIIDICKKNQIHQANLGKMLQIGVMIAIQVLERNVQIVAIHTIAEAPQNRTYQLLTPISPSRFSCLIQPLEGLYSGVMWSIVENIYYRFYIIYYSYIYLNIYM